MAKLTNVVSRTEAKDRDNRFLAQINGICKGRGLLGRLMSRRERATLNQWDE
jgi:hypothetical protein